MLKHIRAIVICASIFASLILIGCEDDHVPSKTWNSTKSELARVTSPNGLFDAVLLMDNYGGAVGGGVDSDVYIVQKGAQVTVKPGTEILSADPFSKGRLVWKRNHLLEIHYDIAIIHTFSNLWSAAAVQDIGNEDQNDFEVEIELIPDSDASALKVDGAFRSLGEP